MYIEIKVENKMKIEIKPINEDISIEIKEENKMKIEIEPINKEISIENQKKIADEIMTRLSIIDNNVILAGGAPRDWSFTKTASDFDFYIKSSDDLNLLSKILPGGFMLAGVMLVADGTEYVPLLDSIVNVYRTNYKGMSVDVVIMQPDTVDYIDHFTNNLCKIYYKNGQLHYTKEFEQALASKTMDIKLPIHLTRHIKKMMLKFPDYKLNFV